MMDVVSIILLVVNIISLGVVVLFSIFGVFELIFGPADAEKLLEKLHIPLNYKQVLIIGFTCLAVMFVTYFLRVKLSINF